MHRRLRTFATALCGAVLAACTHDATTSTLSNPAPPAVTTPNVAVAMTVGTAASIDATRAGAVFSDPAGGGLTYAVVLTGAVNGLTTSGGAIRGTPTNTGVVSATITATDILGRTASDRFALVAFASGLATPQLPATQLQYADVEVPLPAHFMAVINGSSVAAMDNTPVSNPITDAGATLGRVLFFDTRLSANDGTSCGSCHHQAVAFGDSPALSLGFNGALTTRHSPSLVNARFYKRGRFFWDERAATLEVQVLGPIQNSGEMGMTLDNLLLKLSLTPYYASMFAAAFGSPTISSDRVSAALAQYVRSMVSGGSRYDRAFAANGVANFANTLTPAEQQGELLFRSTGCASCHTTVAQVMDSTHNTGLDASSVDIGAGNGAFKVPSLRNVSVRPRFMHDGRFSSLEQVIDFYDDGVQASSSLDARLRASDGSPRRLRLTTVQKSSLVAFLGSLTDSTFLTAARFSNPFVTMTVGTPSAGTANVSIQANSYRPPSIAVQSGTVITYTNLDNSRHSAQFDNGQITSTPIFSTGSRTVTMPLAAGTYTYHCAIHGLAMSGVVVVR